MKSKNELKERAHHGTAIRPLSLYHLEYGASDSQYFYLHWHEEIELVYVHRGGMIYQVDDQEYILNEGDALFINTNQLHSAKSLNQLPCEAIVLVVHPTYFDPNNKNQLYNRYIYPILSGQRLVPAPIKKESPLSKALSDDLHDIYTNVKSPLESWEMLLTGKMYSIFYHLYNHSITLHNTSVNPDLNRFNRLKPVLNYISTHYSEDINLDDLSQLLPMSKGQFCRVFKEAIGMSPIAYVVQQRILKSCELLREENIKITEIARSSGFNNISHYNRAFLKEIGCSPSKYRLEEHRTLKP